MLIEFSVSNYRSFSSEQTLSMETIASKSDKEKPENRFNTKISWAAEKQKDLSLLKSAIIYGANDAGKTNFIKAIITLRNLVLFSFKNPLSENNTPQNFLLDKPLKDKPSFFKVTFIKDKVKYSYAISTDFKKIFSEELISFQYGSPRTIISRDASGLTLKIEGKKQYIEDATKSGSLLLSTALGLDSSDKTLIKVYDFITKDLLIDSGNVSFDFRTKYMILKEKNSLIKTVFQKAIGDGIIDVQLKKDENFNTQKVVNFSVGKDGNFQVVEENQLPQNIQEQFKTQEEINQYKVKLIRQNSQKEKIEFDLTEHESQGTKKLFNYLGPILDTLDKGKVFILDEFTESIHPKLIEFVIKLFHSKETNPKNAQLIMSSHDTSLISKQLDIFRRDQIWFVAKGDGGNSALYPLTDYYTRKDANFTDYYLAGRYGAIREEDSES